MTCPHCGKQHDSSACPPPDTPEPQIKLYPSGPVGWICPVCGVGVSPYWGYCPSCNPTYNFQFYYPQPENTGGNDDSAGRSDKQEED